jgi:hypothetical protein
MWISGTGADVLHCQHCNPSVTWVVYKAEEPPQFAYTGFPKDGQVVLSKGKVIVLCVRCAPSIQMALGELEQSIRQDTNMGTV